MYLVPILQNRHGEGVEKGSTVFLPPTEPRTEQALTYLDLDLDLVLDLDFVLDLVLGLGANVVDEVQDEVQVWDQVQVQVRQGSHAAL